MWEISSSSSGANRASSSSTTGRRWVRADVWITGDLNISGVTVPGEGNRAHQVQRLLLAGADPMAIRRAGVGWLVVEAGTPGDMGFAARTFERLPVTYRGRDVMLYRVGGAATRAPADRRRPAVIAHLVWLTMLIGGAIGTTVAGATRPAARRHGRVNGSDSGS